MSKQNSPDPVGDALRVSYRRFAAIAIFSAAINVLYLSGSIYMLQVYDRVIPSHNVATLVGLSVILLLAYLVQGVLDALRSRMLVRVGNLFDVALQRPIHYAISVLPLRGARPETTNQPLRDLDQIRAFMSGMGPTAFLDMPFMPIFMVMLFVLHPWLGWLAVVGTVVLVGITMLAEIFTKAPVKASNAATGERQLLAESTRRNAEVIRALGMAERLGHTWSAVNERFLTQNTKASDVAGGYSSTAKVLRYILQSGMLGLGAYLVVLQQASGGVMIAASIMIGRALAPIDVALGSWKQFSSARNGLARMREILKTVGAPPVTPLNLPRPTRDIMVEGVGVFAPGTQRVLVRDISFGLRAGAGVAIIGPSGSGKSTLARALVGVWPLARGTIRLDGATFDQWSPGAMGHFVGYLPQDVELFDGTVAANIARFDDEASSDDIIAAARLAGAHDMILKLPDGYATRIGEGGAALSAGQRQRVGLARAAFGNPFLVILDEPNANLDHEGELALTGAIKSLREAGAVVVVVSHRPSALAALDLAIVLMDGQVKAFGPKDEILKAATQPPAAQPAAARGPGLRVINAATPASEKGRVLQEHDA